MASQTAKNILGPSIPTGQNFLTGQITSVFAGAGITNNAQKLYDSVDNIQNIASEKANQLKSMARNTASNMASAAGQTVGSLIGTVNNVLGDATQIKDLAEIAIGHVIAYAKDEVGKAVQEIIKPPMGDIAKKTASYLGEMTKNIPKEIMDALTKNSEKRGDEASKKSIEDTIQNNINKLQEKANALNEKVSNFKKKLDNDMQELSTFMLAGPEWMADKIQTKEDEYKVLVGSYINSTFKQALDAKNAMIDKIAYASASKAYNELVAKNQDKLKDQLNAIEEKKAEVESKGKTKIQQVLFKLWAMIGA